MKEHYEKPEKLKMNPQKLLEMLEKLETTVELHSISVRYQGKIVLEGAWTPFDMNTPQMLHSLSKIGTSICVGFAVEAGKLHLKERMIDYVREDLPESYDPVLDNITIYDLLTMQAGSPECCNNVWFSKLEKNWETEWLKQPKIRSDIGKVFHYDSGCSYTLSRIVTKVMGKNCLALMQERVFEPMKLGKISWLTSPEGHNTGGWGMYLTARQISAIGQLLVQKGMWEGKQLIPDWWVEAMSQPRVAIPGDEKKALTNYAYHIKAGKEIFAAEGAFGQYLICFRDYPVSIGITAGVSEYLAADICLKYIKEALEVPCKQEELEKAKQQLQEKVQTLHLSYAPGDQEQPGELVKGLFGRKIVFTDNPRHIQEAILSRNGQELIMYLTIDGEQKICRAGQKKWISNKLYAGDCRQEKHCLSYGYEEDALNISVGLINTSYKEEYCLWINNDTVVGTWVPNVTYLPMETDKTWKFTGKFE